MAIKTTKTRASGVSGQRIIRIFLSTPSDIDIERVQLTARIRDINDVVQFLLPDTVFRLELIHYETDAFPDIGRGPQGVIDQQIPIDFDVYFGIMWKRCGTPTKDAPSGTVHEFNRALEHRKKHGWPIIMFYFCDEAIPIPLNSAILKQLQNVVAFRKRLAELGYTVLYPNRADFREHARPALLRALADIVKQNRRPASEPSYGSEISKEERRRIEELADAYDDLRATMPSGDERTRKMTVIFHQMTLLAAGLRPMLEALKANTSAGKRLAAIAILHTFPSKANSTWLADRLDPEIEKPFIGYQAAQSLLQAVRSLPASESADLKIEIERALKFAKRLPQDTDRIVTLNYALQELQIKSGKKTA